ncbi:FcoT family thioesterase [Corynebacterium timonense]|uniref:(2E)-enoyl-[ACP] glycyltransferase n=1 Tax=Corynebacterium timonense TaxID=441500 RepID=A0A1H1LWT5_9CORY|nr:FcoT family thioesterase [Corynebacterium timonense]SDR78981.1 FcoT-like thioesterase domain-containing protein [Corynebacterium timonense]
MTTTVTIKAGDDLHSTILDPYKGTNTVYLGDATVELPTGDAVPSEYAEGERVRARASFSIPEPCYIDATGHFNAVEFQICYNQLMYLALAAAVRSGEVGLFRGWTMQDYLERQLPSILIQDNNGHYSRPIDPTDFSAVFEIVGTDLSRLHKGIVKLHTAIAFEDPNGGAASGEVRLALVDVPQASLDHLAAQ